MTKFYTFDQNNSGGRFVETSALAPFVIIEAESAEEANRKALQLGMYFDGVKDGVDCECCGDRWYPVLEGSGEEVPIIYGQSPMIYSKKYGLKDCVETHLSFILAMVVLLPVSS